MSEAVIQLESVHKSFRGNHVLQGVSLEVTRGKTFAFLGRNGAGKTTTIRLLLGLLKRDSGTVRVAGFDPQSDPVAVRSRVGYLAEDQQMYRWMTVDEILRFVAPFYSDWDHSLAFKYVKEFELPLEAKIKTLSKGQNVRLGLVLALAHRPELVVLDDPALGLDPVMRKQFNRDLITHLQGEGTTVFYSSHLLQEVEPVADEVAILHKGSLVRQCGTEELRADVRQFVLSRESCQYHGSGWRVLDARRDGDEVAVVVEQSSQVERMLQHEGVPHRVQGLSLDEIFEAYTAGTPESFGNEESAPSLTLGAP